MEPLATGGTRGERRKMHKLFGFEGYPNGMTMQKAIKMMWPAKNRKSGERWLRVQGKAKAGTASIGSSTDGTGAIDANSAIITANVTPLVATLDSPYGVTLVVVSTCSSRPPYKYMI